MKYFITTFGCQHNYADSERIAADFSRRGYSPARGYCDANYVVVNTCMVRAKAEHRVYGLIHNLGKIKAQKQKNHTPYKIIVTGCMVGLAARDASGKYLARLRSIMSEVDEFMPIEEVGFDLPPVRVDNVSAYVPISNGCNNFCSFCVVPFTRGREVSRPYESIIEECTALKEKGYSNVLLLGQNVNSYGADIIQKKKKVLINGQSMKPVYVKHLGRYRLPTLFPYLLEDVARLGFSRVDFMSSNPWDFSSELIGVIARHPNITRTIHLPVQSGDSAVLRRMNRWYSREEYIALIQKIRTAIPDIRFTTDIIVGFCDETDDEFENTVELCKQVGFEKAYIAMYSPRPQTAATKALIDSVPHTVKKQRWQILEDLINYRFKKSS